MLTCWYPRQYGSLMLGQLPSVPSTPRTMPCTPRGPPSSSPTPGPTPPRRPPTPEAAEAVAAAHALTASEKWWSDTDEPLYLVVTGGAVALGRPCDADDQALWLLEQGNAAAAIHVATEAPYVRPETWAQCSYAFLQHLLDTGDAHGTATHTPCMHWTLAGPSATPPAWRCSGCGVSADASLTCMPNHALEVQRRQPGQRSTSAMTRTLGSGWCSPLRSMSSCQRWASTCLCPARASAASRTRRWRARLCRSRRRTAISRACCSGGHRRC